MIHYACPKAQYLQYKSEIDSAIDNVLVRGNYILGDEVTSFEQEFANYLNIDFAVGCGSGTDALVLALRALNVGLGDEVIVPSHTAVPTVAAIVMAGASPVYVDIEADYFTMDPEQVKKACTAKTKAIIAVHIYGQAVAMDKLMAIAKKNNLRVIEDCAQATGATYDGKKLGTIGDIGCFSFFPTKNLGALGDGGALVCDDDALANRLRRLRQYGWDEDRISQESGINSRLDEIQAAVLRVKLKYLDADNKERLIQASRYIKALKYLPITLPTTREEASHVFHLFVVQTKNRDILLQRLRENNIFLGIHYAVPVHRMPSFAAKKELPVTDKIVKQIVSLPIYPGLTELDQEHVISSVRICEELLTNE